MADFQWPVARSATNPTVARRVVRVVSGGNPWVPWILREGGGRRWEVTIKKKGGAHQWGDVLNPNLST